MELSPQAEGGQLEGGDGLGLCSTLAGSAPTPAWGIAAAPLAQYLKQCSADGRGDSLEEIMVNTEKERLYEKLAQ